MTGVPSRRPADSGPQPPWQTVPYIAPNGACDVIEYLAGVRKEDARSWLRLENIRKLMIERGPFAVGPPYWEGLGDGLYEVRSEQHRIYCSVEPQRLIVMYLAVWKLWPKFLSKHRRLCEARQQDFQSAAYDQEQRELLHKAYSQRKGKNGSL